MGSNSRMLVIAGLIGSALAMSPGGLSHAAPVPQAIAGKKQRRGLFNGEMLVGRALIGSKGARISVAQQKRAAKKARNVKRHRAACKA